MDSPAQREFPEKPTNKLKSHLTAKTQSDPVSWNSWEKNKMSQMQKSFGPLEQTFVLEASPSILPSASSAPPTCPPAYPLPASEIFSHCQTVMRQKLSHLKKQKKSVLHLSPVSLMCVTLCLYLPLEIFFRLSFCGNEFPSMVPLFLRAIF